MRNPKQLVGEREMRLVDDIEARTMQKTAKELMADEEIWNQHDGRTIKFVMEKLGIWEEET